ncbi:endolytic transglycosylase MltG [Demequina sp. TTPB684]|uniref:endolytic transglycosylase MltG n=1 Tax=unclassified Demequina TaxID=2620311 RepID=UPI001CF47DC9|nr:MULTISPECIES: endolytic transglycosylase MltG [unclassified Demequina]MCB2414058.1 endolytic transglycosylase MltG [Demequina sp. TTPB684]UPU89231.1 endolytic transglycosylase MltG [Demequina sp. TMPB413]
MTDLFEAEATTTTSLDLRRVQRLQRRARRRKWTLVLVAIALVVFAIGGSYAYNFVTTTFERDTNEIADYEGVGQGVIQVVIEPGDTGTDIAATLYEAGVIASEQAYINASNANPDSSGIKPGFYFMAREMKAEYALLALLDPNNRDLRKITIPEGKQLSFYYDKIASLTGYSVDEVKAAAEDTAAIGLPAEANGNLEGWLFPSTYNFNPGVTPSDVLREMIATTVQKLDAKGVAPADRLKILTIASLIEMEAGLDVDRPLISGVIYNRLNRDMKLELDATVKYIAPSEGAFVSADDKQVDSPYNTYMYTGLPPGPISGSGEASIDAAIAPASHNYVFYVTVNLDSRETLYAETYDQHLKNTQLLRQWIEENQ